MRHLPLQCLLAVVYPLLCSFSQSYPSKTDSLLFQLNNAVHDTAKLKIYSALFHHYLSTDPRELLPLSEDALTIAKKYDEEYEVATWYNNKSIYFRLQNNADSALYYNLRALRINEQLQNESGIADNLVNAGLIYRDVNNYNKSLTFMKRGVAIKEKLRDTVGLMKSYINMGIVYYDQQKLDSALVCYLSSLKMSGQLGDSKGRLLNMMNIGSIYYKLKDWESAKNYYLRTLQLCREIEEKEVRSAALNNIGLVYKELSDYKNAIGHLEEAIKIAEETGSKSDLAEANYNLSEIYQLTGDFETAYEYQKQYSENMADIHRNAKGIGDIQTDYEIEKREATIREKDQSIIEETTIRKKVLLGSSILVGVLLVISGFVFVQKQKLKTGKQQMELENQILGKANMEMKARMQEIISTLEQNEILSQTHSGNQKYKTSTLTTEQRKQYMERLLNYMDKEKPYLDPELTLSGLGEALSIKPHNLSEVLNESLGKNFYDFINMYRIEVVKEKMGDPKKFHLTLLGLAFDAGFNSKTAFNRAFKKATGLPPSRYRQKYVMTQ